MSELQRAVWAVNLNLPVANVQTLEDIRASSMAQTSFALTMLAIAVGMALLLGLVGIYGVVAYIAAQRTREIGVRMALGAQASDIRTLFVTHGLKLVGAGRRARRGGRDGAHAAAVDALLRRRADGRAHLRARGLGAVALMATYLPGRAARVDPVVALRSDA